MLNITKSSTLRIHSISSAQNTTHEEPKSPRRVESIESSAPVRRVVRRGSPAAFLPGGLSFATDRSRLEAKLNRNQDLSGGTPRPPFVPNTAAHRAIPSKGEIETSSPRAKSLDANVRNEEVQDTQKDAPDSQKVTTEMLKKIVPSLSDKRAEEISPHLDNAMKEAGIETKRQKAAFISQLAHESMGFTQFSELSNGRKYEGRTDLGNTEPGDGPRYKGRGPIQLTGRENYRNAGKDLGLDLEGHPELVEKPEVGFKVAAWYWNQRNLNKLAEDGDFRGVTKKINGGLNGYSDRLSYYKRALEVLPE